jgi:hypothetical protein
MTRVYIRVEIECKRTFRKAPKVPSNHEYWLREQNNGKQKWHRVGEWANVKKATLLLERERVAKQWRLVSPSLPGRLSVGAPADNCCITTRNINVVESGRRLRGGAVAKGNDKKVVKQTRDLLLSALGNLWESHRERNFRYKTRPRPFSRKKFCEQHHLVMSTVAHIETGRFLALNFSQLRTYLAAIYGHNDADFSSLMKRMYDGLKELDAVLEEL